MPKVSVVSLVSPNGCPFIMKQLKLYHLFKMCKGSRLLLCFQASQSAVSQGAWSHDCMLVRSLYCPCLLLGLPTGQMKHRWQKLKIKVC